MKDSHRQHGGRDAARGGDVAREEPNAARPLREAPAGAGTRPEDSGEPSPRAGDAQPADTAPAAPATDTVDYKERWLRAEADFQNFRRRAQRDIQEERRAAEERVIMEMVHALDDLERALDAAPAAGVPEAWLGGVRLVANRMGEYLDRAGVTAMHPVGERFDPAFHEAMLEVDQPDVEPGHVVQVVLRGYRRGDRVLRPARVVVAKHPAGSEL